MTTADAEKELNEILGMTAIGEDVEVTEGYKFVGADAVDLSDLRGVAKADHDEKGAGEEDSDLDNLAELVPDVKNRRRHSSEEFHGGGGGHMMTGEAPVHVDLDAEVVSDKVEGDEEKIEVQRKLSLRVGLGEDGVVDAPESSLRVQESGELENSSAKHAMPTKEPAIDDYQAEDEASSRPRSDSDSLDYPDSDLVLGDEGGQEMEEKDVPKEFMNMSSAQSISTATQTANEVRMPMYLPTFKPATGCTNASDFIVRCFVARLRAGITVVKHGRSRWCKSRLRVLHIHPDGRSLTWKPAEGEPASSKRPPKLDLSTCIEVRHAWSPDPQNPMYTGTSILRQKCEAANAHKSFALIFKGRTVDITAVTADQCKVLMEGFSALCFRLQVANMAGRGQKKNGNGKPLPEEDGLSTTASNTLTNTSTPKNR